MLENVQDLLNLLKESALDLGSEFVDLTGRTEYKDHYKEILKVLNQLKADSTMYTTLYTISIIVAVLVLIYMAYQLIKGNTSKKWLGLVVLGLAGFGATNFTLDNWAIQDYDAIIANETAAMEVEYLKSTEGHEHRSEKEFSVYYDLMKIKFREPNMRLSPAGIKALSPELLATYYGNHYSIFQLDKLEIGRMSADRTKPIYYFMTDKFRELHAKNSKQLIESANLTMTMVGVINVVSGLLIGIALVKREDLSAQVLLIFLAVGLGFVLAIHPFLSTRVTDLKTPSTRYFNQVEEVINATK